MENKKAPVGAEEENRYKNSKYFNQLTLVQLSFFERPKTMKMVDKETGVMRENICRYKRIMQRSGAIWLINKSICPITRHRAGFYSTNPRYAENLPQQFKLF